MKRLFITIAIFGVIALGREGMQQNQVNAIHARGDRTTADLINAGCTYTTASTYTCPDGSTWDIR